MIFMKKINYFLIVTVTSVCTLITSCAYNEGSTTYQGFEKRQGVDFDIVITRTGDMKTRSENEYSQFASVADADDSSMDSSTPFGLIGIDANTSKVIINNEQVYDNGGSRSVTFDTHNWYGTEELLLSAYYPHVNDIEYMSGNRAYIIPYRQEETEAGPLVSQTVKRSVSYMDVVPLVFRHITNDVGFKICDITYDEQLRGLIRLRKMIAHNVATEGYYIDSIGTDGGKWIQKSICDGIQVFDGNARVGVGSDNELFVGYDHLVSDRNFSSRFYSIPEEIRMGKQYVEVVFDVDAFEYGGQKYPELKNQVQKFPIYGVLPGNTFIYGKQYTFHLGLDLGTLYKSIEFTASVADWNETSAEVMNNIWGENKIYEDNDYF